MDACDDEVEVLKDRRREVERTVFTDIALNPVEHENAVRLPVQLPDLLPLFCNLLFGEPPVDLGAFHVIADGDIPVPPLTGSGSQLPDRVLPVAPAGMEVEIPPYGTVRYYLREDALLCRFDLAPVFPQFRLDIGKIEHPVEVLLGRPGTVLPALFFFHAVLGEAPSPVKCPAPEGDVVVLGPGKILEGGPVLPLLHHAQVDLHTRRKDNGAPGGATAEHPGHLGKRAERFHNRLRIGRGCKEIDVPYRLLHPPDRTGKTDLPDRGQPGEMFLHVHRDREHRSEEEAAGCAFACSNPLQDVSLALLAKPEKTVDLPFPGRHLELPEVVDPELLVEHQCLLWPYPRDLRNLPHPGPHILLQPFEILELSRAEDLPELGGDMGPDTGEILQPVAFGNPVDIFRQGLDPMGSPPVRNRFELHILDLEQVGDLVQDRRYLPVVQFFCHAVPKRCIRAHGTLMVTMLAENS